MFWVYSLGSILRIRWDICPDARPENWGDGLMRAQPRFHIVAP
jgi:hypothetical protein